MAVGVEYGKDPFVVRYLEPIGDEDFRKLVDQAFLKR